MKKIKLFLLAFLGFQMHLSAQVGIGISNPNSNAMLEVNSSNKGFLLSRVVLISTNNPSPLTAHVAGMTVFNTATNTSVAANPVYPGEYYNDGTQWLRKISAAETKIILGGTLADQLAPTSITMGNASAYNEATLLTPLTTFTLDKPSIVEFTANVSTIFSRTNDLPLTDDSAKLASAYFVFTSAPSGITTNKTFGNSSVSYSNYSSTNSNVISGYFYLVPHSILNLPAGNYTIALRGGGASDSSYKLTFGDGGSDSFHIKAIPVK